MKLLKAIFYGLWAGFKCLFWPDFSKRKFYKKEVRKPMLFQMGGGWGDAINWSDWDKRQVVGWKTPKPQKGDYLKAKMESGKVALFKFGTMKYCGNPHDMFFADVKDIGYEDKVKLPEFFQESSQFRFI